jgi:hypothetical protein
MLPDALAVALGFILSAATSWSRASSRESSSSVEHSRTSPRCPRQLSHPLGARHHEPRGLVHELQRIILRYVRQLPAGCGCLQYQRLFGQHAALLRALAQPAMQPHSLVHNEEPQVTQAIHALEQDGVRVLGALLAPEAQLHGGCGLPLCCRSHKRTHPSLSTIRTYGKFHFNLGG